MLQNVTMMSRPCAARNNRRYCYSCLFQFYRLQEPSTVLFGALSTQLSTLDFSYTIFVYQHVTTHSALNNIDVCLVQRRRKFPQNFNQIDFTPILLLHHDILLIANNMNVNIEMYFHASAEPLALYRILFSTE